MLKGILEKAGLSSEQITSILSSMKEAKVYTTNLENIDERYSKLKQKKEDLEGQLNGANTTITELKKNNKDIEGLQVTIKKYETDMEQLKTDSEAKIRNITIDSAITSLLKDNKAKHADLLLGKFDRDKLSIKEDGSIEGLDTQFASIKESYKDLFEQPLSGDTPNNSGGSAGGVDVSKMTYSQMMDYMAKNPDAKI